MEGNRSWRTALALAAPVAARVLLAAAILVLAALGVLPLEAVDACLGLVAHGLSGL